MKEKILYCSYKLPGMDHLTFNEYTLLAMSSTLCLADFVGQIWLQLLNVQASQTIRPIEVCLYRSLWSFLIGSLIPEVTMCLIRLYNVKWRYPLYLREVVNYQPKVKLYFTVDFSNFFPGFQVADEVSAYGSEWTDITENSTVSVRVSTDSQQTSFS